MEREQPIRVVIPHYRLLRYRVPVFRELASRSGIDLRVVCGKTEGAWLGQGEPHGFETIYTSTHAITIAGRELRWQSAHWHYASRRHTDVLILPWNLHFVTLVPALIKAKATGVRTILWGHGYSKSGRGWSQRLQARIARLATAILFYNHTRAKEFLDGGWEPHRTHVALNSLDQEPIQRAREACLRDPQRLEQFRRDHDLSDGPVVLFVSCLFRENRVEMLINAARNLRREFPSLRVVIIGDGPDRQRLEAVAAETGMADRTLFAGAIFDEDQLAPWFLSAVQSGGAFCYPANIGLSILHAFGYGLPVVTSDRLNAQNPEIEALEPGKNGLLYKDGDVEDLAGTLTRLFRDSDLHQQLSRNARETVLTRFNVERMVDGLEGAVRYAASVGSRSPFRPRSA